MGDCAIDAIRLSSGLAIAACGIISAGCVLLQLTNRTVIAVEQATPIGDSSDQGTAVQSVAATA